MVFFNHLICEAYCREYDGWTSEDYQQLKRDKKALSDVVLSYKENIPDTLGDAASVREVIEAVGERLEKNIENKKHLAPVLKPVINKSIVNAGEAAKIGHSQATVAKEIGVSEATLSQFLSDTYKGNNKILYKKVEQFIRNSQKRLVPPTPPEFVVTSTVKDIWYAVKYAHMRHDIALVYGDAGRGKSKDLKEYALRNKRVIYIEADATIQNTKSILEEIWKAIGKRNPEPERYMKEGIIEELKNSDALIIIDEANQLNYKALEALRALNDKGEIGIVLAGSPYIFEKMNGRNEMLYAQIISRIGMRKHLFGNIPKDDIEAILKEKDLNKEWIKFLHKLANGRGGLTYMIKIYLLAETVARTHKEDLDVKHLSMAHKMQSGQY